MRARGFTLVEVMVALAIVAIALPAVLMSLYRQIDDTAYLRDKTLAQMVAANKLAEMRLVIASTRALTAGKDNGVAQMADREWYWWVETKPAEGVPKFFRIEIRIGLSEEEEAQPLYAMTAFMSSDLKFEEPTGGDAGGGGDGDSEGGAGDPPPGGQDTDPVDLNGISGLNGIPGLDSSSDLTRGVPDGQ